MKKLIVYLVIALFTTHIYSQTKMKTITKNGMTVSWEFKENKIYFEMLAPTDGWVAIGFNDNDNTKGNYLIMGNVIKNKVSVEEHFTISSGNYKSFYELGVTESVENNEGSELGKITKLKFSLPQTPTNKYAKNLKKGSEYILLIAYSQEDDFQHHSIMRTSRKVTL